MVFFKNLLFILFLSGLENPFNSNPIFLFWSEQLASAFSNKNLLDAISAILGLLSKIIESIEVSTGSGMGFTIFWLWIEKLWNGFTSKVGHFLSNSKEASSDILLEEVGKGRSSDISS